MPLLSQLRIHGRAAPFALALLLATAAEAAESASAAPEAALRGFNLTAEVWATSGLEFAPGAYLSQLYLVLTPTYELGARHFQGTWAEPLKLSGRLYGQVEFTGNSEDTRGPHFAAPATYGDTSGPAGGQSTTGGALPGWTDRGGLERRPVLSDLWLAVAHDRLWTVPGLAADVQGGLRVVLPTSAFSLNSGMIAAPSAFVGLARKVTAGVPIELTYGVRTTRYFFQSNTIRVQGANEPVLVDGHEVTPLQLASTGDVAPAWMVSQDLGLTFELPRDVSLAVSYSLVETWNHTPASCSVEGAATADTCRDGSLVGRVNRSGWSEAGSFSLEGSWAGLAWGTLGLGLSTYAPVRNLDGTLGNPFVRVNRNNLTTMYLSISVDAETLAGKHDSNAAKKEGGP